MARLLVIGLLPLRRTIGGRYLHRGDLVFRTVRGPVGIIGRDDVGLGIRMMEGGVDHARRDPLGDQGAQGGFTGAAGSLTQSPSRTPRCSASWGWISSRSSSCQTILSVRRVCAPTLYWLRMRPVVSSSGKRGPVRSSVGIYSVMTNLPLPRTKPSMCMTGVPSGASRCRAIARSRIRQAWHRRRR